MGATQQGLLQIPQNLSVRALRTIPLGKVCDAVCFDSQLAWWLHARAPALQTTARH